MKFYVLMSLNLSGNEKARPKMDDAIESEGWKKYRDVDTAWHKELSISSTLYGSDDRAEHEAMRLAEKSLSSALRTAGVANDVRAVLQVGRIPVSEI